MRATYRRPHGTEQFLGFYDVHADLSLGQEPARRRRECQDASTRKDWLPGQVSNLRHPD
jgi:hypothetical protein